MNTLEVVRARVAAGGATDIDIGVNANGNVNSAVGIGLSDEMTEDDSGVLSLTSSANVQKFECGGGSNVGFHPVAIAAARARIHEKVEQKVMFSWAGGRYSFIIYPLSILLSFIHHSSSIIYSHT